MYPLSKLSSLDLVVCLPKLVFKNDKICDSCAKGKYRRSSFKSKYCVSTSKPLQLFHLDLFRLTRTTSLSGKSYGLFIVDD